MGVVGTLVGGLPVSIRFTVTRSELADAPPPLAVAWLLAVPLTPVRTRVCTVAAAGEPFCAVRLQLAVWPETVHDPWPELALSTWSLLSIETCTDSVVDELLLVIAETLKLTC
jgi:hypothetical protein